MSELREPLTRGLSQLWELDRVIWEGDTAFQHVVIAETEQGVSLFCDNDPQSTELAQRHYHDALFVPAALLAERVERVLAVGSSEGVISQLAVAAGATHVDHVDIDREVVELCAEHLPYGYTPEELERAERGDGPVKMHYADGWEFVRRVAENDDEDAKYDIIVADLPGEREDDAQHNRLFGTEFLRYCVGALREGGVVTSQVGCPTLWLNTMLRRALARFSEVFGTVAYYGSDEFDWAFLVGRPDVVADPTARMVERLSELPYRPTTLDAEALVANSVLPYTLRQERKQRGEDLRYAAG
ncbi:spermidine synthase [Saccharomonospora viridis]|uniref:Polyamine aminopropyltransferase n=2 Tax=Saccharomonospora viridis TaxID=1852 RepID=C7MSU0_SACVD|nr:spermidine synthase [Saccharomonospora viridis]ACU95301.1 spermidine synthase [Saccharomonospora viridis DSM 43017]KHF44932.1 spermidine synthase [Saccharomonospora viridis]SFP17514.1 spermidine synthase [Saccharomonospora viridis]